MTTPDKNRSQEVEVQISRLEARLAKDPGTTAFPLLADLYTRTGRLLDAIQVCRDGLKQHPRLASGHVSLGRALFGSGNLPVAAKVLHRSLALDDVTAESFRLLGEVMLRLARPAEAVKLLERARARGFSERSIAVLLKKARAAHVSARRAKAASEGDRGLGNVAISGTINTEAEETRPMPVLSREELKEEAAREEAANVKARVDRAPGVKRGLAPRVRTDVSLRRLPLEIFRVKEDDPMRGWSSIDDAWERTLDASQVSSSSGPEIKTPTPGFEPMDVPVAPLTDPLAEPPPPTSTDGMPPVPEDAGEEDRTAAYPQGDDIPVAEELVPTVPEGPGPLSELHPLDDEEAPATDSDGEVTPRLQGHAEEAATPAVERLVPMDEATAAPAELKHPPDVAAVSAVQRTSLIREEPEEVARETAAPGGAAEPEHGEGGVGSLDADVGSLDAHVESLDAEGIEEALDGELNASKDEEDAPTIRFVRVPEDELFLEDAEPPEEPTDAVQTPARARRGRLLLALFVLAVLLLFGVGAALGWYLYEHKILGFHLVPPAPQLRA